MKGLRVLWSVNLAMHFPIVFFLAVGPFLPGTIAPPNPDNALRNADAGSRGFPLVLVKLTQAFQHLTVCTQNVLTLYLLLSLGDILPTTRRVLRAILFPAGAIVGVLFWALCYWSPNPQVLNAPWTVFPRGDFPEDKARAEWVISTIIGLPSLEWPPSFFMFGLMHLQHTLMPLFPWFEHLCFAMPPPLGLKTEMFLVYAFLLGWVAWSVGVCWHVRGAPAYPILRLVWEDGTWPYFYGGIAALALWFLTLGRLWRHRLVCRDAPLAYALLPFPADIYVAEAFIVLLAYVLGLIALWASRCWA